MMKEQPEWKLLPYQEQFLKTLAGCKSEAPMCNDVMWAVTQFDNLTTQGWKLDMIRGVYVRQPKL